MIFLLQPLLFNFNRCRSSKNFLQSLSSRIITDFLRKLGIIFFSLFRVFFLIHDFPQLNHAFCRLKHRLSINPFNRDMSSMAYEFVFRTENASATPFLSYHSRICARVRAR